MNGLKERGTALENKWAREQDAKLIAAMRAKDTAATTATDKDKKKS
ncbi:MAG: hypothetical protein K2X77_34135 [Candidatus Obscuribacterales bacterium]|jgi:hypothetical protein|nr:hypothetical protein [Candidatus Obscuribacterales bacterium]